MPSTKTLIQSLLLSAVLFAPLALAAGGKLAGLEAGERAFNAGNFKLAFSHWQTEATRGNADAQVFVGLSYANGWGVSKNPRLASVWYQKAADKNHTSGQLLLGLYYIQQRGAERAAGLSWLKRAAGAGDKEAQAFLKKGYAKGWFTDIDPRGSLGKQPQKTAALSRLADG
jgi:TPR repeat protein